MARSAKLIGSLANLWFNKRAYCLHVWLFHNTCQVAVGNICICNDQWLVVTCCRYAFKQPHKFMMNTLYCISGGSQLPPHCLFDSFSLGMPSVSWMAIEILIFIYTFCVLHCCSSRAIGHQSIFDVNFYHLFIFVIFVIDYHDTMWNTLFFS